MRIHRTGKIIALLMAFLLAVGLSGCTTLNFVPGSDAPSVTMPAPTDTVPPGLLGDSRAEYSYRATLYYISSDQQQLAPIVRSIRLVGDDMLAEAVVNRLLEPSGSVEAHRVAPEDTTLLSLEISQRIATVNLSIDALNVRREEETLWMKAAIAHTLLELDGIDSVNVLIGGKEESVLGLPSGTLGMDGGNISTLGANSGNLMTLWAHQEAEQKRFSNQDAAESAFIDRTVSLYFAANDGAHLIPETRAVRFNDDDYMSALIHELLIGPKTTASARGILPRVDTAEALMAQPPDIYLTEDGQRIIRFYFIGEFYEKLRREDITPWQFFGPLTLTMCRFVPEIDGVMAYVGEGRVIQVPGQEEITFDQGYMTPAHFASSIGSTATLYFSTEDGSLLPIQRVMDLKSARSPRSLLDALIAGPYEYEKGAGWVVPEGITAADILGLRIEGDVIHLNLSSNFYRCCQNLTPVQERNLVYAIVNTLTEIEGVRRVRFFIDGDFVDTLVSAIYLRGALIRNPGIIKAH